MNYNAKHEGAYQSFKNQSDCPTYRATLARHARQLIEAGVDHVVRFSTALLSGYMLVAS